MKEEKEDIVAIIKTGDYIDELEQKVKLATEEILLKDKQEKIYKKYVPIEIPDFGKDLKAKKDWEMREIEKCMKGDGNIPGKYYFYLNHIKIKNKHRGKIRPDFRTKDLEWFRFLENIEKTPGKGIICVKRRQVGMSWKAASDMVYDCQFRRDFDIGANSKGISDSQQLLAKVKYVYRNQDDFLRVATSTDRRDAMLFAVYDKDEFGNRGKLKSGTESSIVVHAPTIAAHSGSQYLKLIMDEFGETIDADLIFANAEDCLIQDGVRYGVPVLFGSMGQTDKAGATLMDFWKNAEAYDLERFPFWGYHELIMDEFGNDLEEESIRWIIYNRKKKENGSVKVYNKFIQRYPLNEDDAFLLTAAYGVGNPAIINKQLGNLILDCDARPGRMKMVGEQPIFEPNPSGHCTMMEEPQKLKDGYTASLDPAEDDNVTKTKDSSDVGFSILARPLGLLPQRVVFEYCHRPAKLEEAYQQMAMACLLYGCKINIEMNKGGWRAYDWFAIHYPDLLALPPVAANALKNGVKLEHGVKMTTTSKMQMEGLLNQYLDNHTLPNPSIGYKGVQSKKFLTQCKVFGGKGKDDDLAVSVGWNLIIQQGDRKVAKPLGQEEIPKGRPHLGYHNGVLRRIGQDNKPVQIRGRTIPRKMY